MVLSISTYFFILKDLPSIEDLKNKDQKVTTRILDRHGNILYRIFKDENRTVVPLASIPRSMIQATIAIEDQDFYIHHGFSLRGVSRALIANLKSEDVQGGSTITQQLVKNKLLTPEKTIQRKLKELALSLLVDWKYSKDEILEMYFNEISYGGSTYGVEEASQRYFGKSSRELSLGESALLAGLPAAPSVYSPFGTHPELAYTRQAEVLRRMTEEGFITSEEANAARKEQLSFRNDTSDIKAPHFVMYIRSLLAEKYGEELVTQGGLEVWTTLDLEVQAAAEKAVTAELKKVARLNVKNGAAMVTMPTTGEVLAMVGSSDYFDLSKEGQVNVTLRPRQPGSSIKPITYAAAFSANLLSPSSIISDTPITFKSPGSPPYSPENYDGKFHGNVTAKESLGSSYNIPAIKTLALTGLNPMIDLAEQMGITTWQDRKRFGLSLTLGGGEVLMTDMMTAYGVFANYGYKVELNPILEITTYKGEKLYENTCALSQSPCAKTPILDPRVAYQITDILMDNKARTPAFGQQSVLYIPNQQVAVKTGTTNYIRDNWTFGYTSQYVVGTWVGNNDNTPMSNIASGVTGASPIWNSIMRQLLSDEQPHIFPQPTGLLKVTVCQKTGTLPCGNCGPLVEAYFIPGTEPKKACSTSAPLNASPLPTPVTFPEHTPSTKQKITNPSKPRGRT